MSNNMLSGTPRNVAKQEQILAEAQKRLERIDRMRAEMAKQVEAEIKLLNEMREKAEKFVEANAARPPSQPSLTNASPASFQSQYDQFGATKSNERLKPISNKDTLIDHLGKLKAPDDREPAYHQNDRTEHWTSLHDDPGKPVYVSGRYVASGHGNNSINSVKEYEYELSLRALPVSVGDVLSVPVHPTGHRDGKAFTTGHLQLQVTDIYASPKFHSYHDRIE